MSQVKVEVYKSTGKYYTQCKYDSLLAPFDSRDKFLEEYKRYGYPEIDKVLVFIIKDELYLRNKFIIKTDNDGFDITDQSVSPSTFTKEQEDAIYSVIKSLAQELIDLNPLRTREEIFKMIQNELEHSSILDKSMKSLVRNVISFAKENEFTITTDSKDEDSNIKEIVIDPKSKSIKFS